MKPDNNEDQSGKKIKPKEESDEEEYDNQPVKKRRTGDTSRYNLRNRTNNELVKFLQELDDESDQDNQEQYPYLEPDFSRMQASINKHVLEEFQADERSKVRNQVRRGVKRAFDMFSECQKDSISEFGDPEPTSNMWKLGCGPREIKKYQKELRALRKEIRDTERVTIVNILESKLPKNDKKTALQLFDMLQNADAYSTDYMLLKKQLAAILDISRRSVYTPEQLEGFMKQEERLKQIMTQNKPLKIRILEADLDEKIKAHIYDRYLQMERTRDDSVTAANIREWIEHALKVPFNSPPPSIIDEQPAQVLLKIKNGLDAKLYGMEEVKEQLLCTFNNRLNNPGSRGIVISLIGNAGTGKTEISRSLAEILQIPFEQISLGGMVDSSILDGQHQGWVGSSPGRIVKALQKMGGRHGIIFFDEIDKLGETPHGREVQDTLLHILDFVQNSEFHDHYIGQEMPIDLSKIIFVTAMNKTEGLDPALVSRLPLIKIPDYTFQQKKIIAENYILPTLLKNVSLQPGDITLDPMAVGYIIEKVRRMRGPEGGVRGLKDCLTTIVNKLSVLLTVPYSEQLGMNLSFAKNGICKPVVISNDLVDLLYKQEDNDRPSETMYI